MNKIKFSHVYSKLMQIQNNTVTLLDVIPVCLENLSPEFIAYDTDNGLFKLPQRGQYLMLIFAKDKSNIFTTLRRRTEEKETYYRKLIGQDFIVEIKEIPCSK